MMSSNSTFTSSTLTSSHLMAAASGVAMVTMDAEDDAAVTTALIDACESEEVNKVRELLSADEQAAKRLATVDQCGRTLLHYCCTNHRTLVVDLLLERWRQTGSESKARHGGGLLERQDWQGLTALALAVIADNHVIVEHLLMMGADVCCLDNERHTVMHLATVCGHLKLIEYLHVHGADITTADQYGATPLHYAVQMCAKHHYHQQQQLQDGKDEDDKEMCREDDDAVSVHEMMRVSVLRAVLMRTAIIDSVDQHLRSPLTWAASCGSREACEELLTAGANTEAADVDGLTALHCASSHGQAACVDALLASSANVNSVDCSGCTPLFYAITLGHAHCVTSLLCHGADPNHVDLKGRTPAHCAAVIGNVEMLQTLRSERGNLWMASHLTGNFPFHEAALARHIDAVRYLLSVCRDQAIVNLSTVNGRSCLHIAALTGDVELLRFLLDFNANCNLTVRFEGNELTAYDVARATGHADCVELLLQIGAKSAADCRGGKVGRETEQVVQQARDAAAREAEYWVTDELELRQRAAHLVAATINHAAASLTTSYCNDDRNNDHDRQQTSRKTPNENPVDGATGHCVPDGPASVCAVTRTQAARRSNSRTRTSSSVCRTLRHGLPLMGDGFLLRPCPGVHSSASSGTAKAGRIGRHLSPLKDRATSNTVSNIQTYSDRQITTSERQRQNLAADNNSSAADVEQKKRKRKKTKPDGRREKNIIQQLVRVFEVKRLTTSKLHDVRRHQLYMEHVPATLSSKYVAKDHPRSAVYQRAVTRRLVNDFNTDGDTRGISLRADENQLTDFPHFEKYLRHELQRAAESEKVLKRIEKCRRSVEVHQVASLRHDDRSYRLPEEKKTLNECRFPPICSSQTQRINSHQQRRHHHHHQQQQQAEEACPSNSK